MLLYSLAQAPNSPPKLTCVASFFYLVRLRAPTLLTADWSGAYPRFCPSFPLLPSPPPLCSASHYLPPLSIGGLNELHDLLSRELIVLPVPVAED